MSKFTTEDDIEEYNLELLDALGYGYKNGYTLEPEGAEPERQSFGDVLLKNRLTQALAQINPHIPPDIRQQAQRELQNIASPDLINNNETFHRYLTEGITVEYQRDGQTKGEQLWLIDWDTPDNNEFLAVNQFTVIEDNHNRRPDIILFINGLPLVAIELKNAADAKADLQAAFNQLQTYKREIPSLFTYNALLVISDGTSARAGSLSASFSRFSQWKRKLPNGDIDNNPDTNELEILTQGMLNKSTLLDLIRHFTVFEKIKTVDPKTEVVTLQTIKKLAAYHQYYAVNKAVERVIAATKSNHRGGVVWHTQGSGKSLSMVFLSGKLVLMLDNPTLVILTDRNDLDDLELVIVCDMWLTGFDAPSLHTMYIDKPMKGHNLMQAIARINRVYFEKQGGLIVDYLGVAQKLKEALNFYSQSGGKGDLTLDKQVAIGLLLTKLEVVEDIIAGFNYQLYFTASTGNKLNVLKAAANYVADPQIKDRFLDAVTALSKIYALTAHHPEAIAQSEKISFFQAIQASLRKLEPTNGSLSNAEIETAIRQVVAQALVSDTVINIFDEAGIKSPDFSIISDEFLEEVEGMEHQNLAVELLKKLLRDEIKAQRRTNIVQSRQLTEMLEDSLRRYQNQVISVTDVIQELINISKDVQAAKQRGEELKLEPYELAFYDALAQSQSARDVMGQDQLRELAVVLVARVRQNASIDWNLKESVRARMKVMVKRLLRQYGYPPDMQALAIELVLEQAKVFTEFEVETNLS